MHEGRVAAQAQREFTQHFPRPGWVEHDATRDLGDAARDHGRTRCARRATPRDIAAVGITNQRETTVLWDRASGRAGRARHRLAGPPHGGRLRATARRRPRTRRSPRAPACCSIPIFPAPSSPGCSTMCRGARARAERGELAFGTIDSWLLFKLTGASPSRHRRHQRQPDTAAAICAPATGTTGCSICCACRAPACRRWSIPAWRPRRDRHRARWHQTTA